MKQRSLLLLLSLVLVSTAFQIKNINHQLPLQSSQDYTQYIKAVKGLSTQEQLSSNPILSAIVQNQRFSLLNSIEDIVLVLVDQTNQESESLPSLEDIKHLQGMQSFFEGFDIMNLASLNEETLSQKISQLQNAGKVVHTLQISEELAKEFENHSQRRLIENQPRQSESQSYIYEQSQKIIHKPNTLTPSPKVAQTGTKSPSYILKFFFSLLFIIVSLGSLGAIANMENKKDTLLYAKFIADVQAR